MADLAASPRFDIGRVIQRTFGIVGRNFGVFALLALLLAGIPQGILQWQNLQVTVGGETLNAGAGVLLAIAGIVAFVGAFALQAALVHGAIADLNGRKVSFGECLATGLRFFLPILGITFLLVIALAVGFVLLIVPGVLMALAWSIVVPVEVVERKGVIGSFGRSADLTRNHRGAILGLYVLYWIASVVVGALVGGLIGGFMGVTTGRPLQGVIEAQALIMAVVQAFETLVGAAGIASVYYELRQVKEGVGPEALAAVFD